MLPAHALHEIASVGRLVDFAILFTLAEYLFFGWRGRWRPKAMIDLLFTLSPGVCLMLALRIALSGAWMPWVVVLLSASLPLHLADLSRRKPR
jgi:hypothetical protein